MSVTGIVLAGGRATRFGGPKLAAELDGRSLLARAIDSLSQVAGEILVAGPELAELSDLADLPGAPRRTKVDPRLVVDAAPLAGPLAALEGALREARGALAVVVGGDMPFLVPEVLQAMVDRLEADLDVESVVLGAPDDTRPAADGTQPRRQVLPLAVRVGHARLAARDALGAGDRSLRSLLDRLACEAIPPGLWLPLDPGAATLLDVDTRADLQRIRGGGSNRDRP